jgi:hypothetical protein
MLWAMTNTPKRLALLGIVSALAIGPIGGTALAKNGADDPAGHNRGDDHAKIERMHHKRHRHHARAHAARHRADDGRNHDKGDDKGAR